MISADTRRCEQCGELYVPRKYWQRFCSEKCRMDHANGRRKEALKLLARTEAGVGVASVGAST